MKRLNLKLLIIVAATAIVLCVGVYGVHAIQTKRNVGSLLQFAETSEQAGDLRQAIGYYSRYLQHQPGNTAQQAKLALLYLKFADSPDGTRRDLERAYGYLNDTVQKLQIRDEKNDLPEIREKLVDLQLKVGAFALAKDHLLRMKAANKAAGKEDPMVDLKLAKCQIQTANYADAVKLLEPLVGYDPDAKTFDAAKAKAPQAIEAYVSLALLLQDRISDAIMPKRKELADEVMEQLTKVNADNPEALLAQAQYFMQRSAKEKALPLIDQALALAPNDTDAILLSAQLAIEDKDYGKAEELLTRGLKENPKDSRMYRGLSQVSLHQNKLEDAEKFVRDGLIKLPNDPALLDSRFDLQLLRKDFDGAANTLKLLETAQVPAPLRELMNCRLLLMRSQYAEAAKRLEALRPKMVGNEALTRQINYFLMTAYQQMQELDKVDSIVDQLPGELLNGQISKAQSLASQGKYGEALEQYEAIARSLGVEKLTKTPAAWRPLYELRAAAQQNKPKEARQWQKLDSLVASLREQQAIAEPNLSLLEIDLLVRKGENDQAQAKLEALGKEFADNAAVVSALARFAAGHDDIPGAMRILSAAPAATQNDSAIITTRIEVISASKGKPEEKASQLTKIGESIESLPEDVRLQAYTTLGGAFIQQGNVADAQRWWNKAAELRPDDVRIRWMMFDLARSAGDAAAMKEIGQWYSTKLGADSEQARLIEAALLVAAVRDAQKQKIAPNQNEIALDPGERESLKKARQLLSNVREQRPGWHEIPKLLAEIDILENHFDEAIANLEEALQLGPANGLMIRQLVHLFYARNQFDKARVVLEKYSSLVGSDMQKLKVMIEQQGGNKISEEQIDKVVDENSTNVSDLLFRGNLLSNSGKADEAEATFRKAIALGPDYPEVWLALVGHLAKNKKGLAAHEVMQEAQIQLPEDRRALTLAQGYEALNDLGQADQFYQTALEAAPDDLAMQRAMAAYYLRTQRVARANAYLESILRHPPAASEQNENFSWARREKAKMLAAEPSYQQFVQAIEFLKPLPGAAPDPQDLALKAALLSERGDPASSREALRTLALLKQQRGSLLAIEQLLEAQLQERLGNWATAKNQMMSLVGQPKAAPMLFAAYIDMLLRNGGAQEATTWLTSLKNAGFNATGVAGLSARIDTALGREQRATETLKQDLPTERPLPKEQWQHLREIAGQLEQLKQYGDAEKLLREYVGYVPQDTLLLVAFLGNRGRVDEAIDMVDKVRMNFAPSPVLQVLLFALRQNIAPPTKEQIQRAEVFFDRAMRDDPESSLVQIQVAGLRELQGRLEGSQSRYDEAEKLYREVLKRTETRPRDRAVVANNLAFLLAVQGKQLDEALKLVNESVAYLGPQSDILDTLGLVHLAQGNAKQAVADFTDASMGSTPDASKLFHLAMAQAALGDLVAAGKTMDKVKGLKIDLRDLSLFERAKYEALTKQLGGQT